MKKLYIYTSILLIASLFWVGCQKNSTNDLIPSEMGTLNIRLTDAPGEFEAVNITFSEISAHMGNDWITITDTTNTINLLEWNNGKSILIGTADIKAGHYTQIRLIIDDAEVIIDGQAYPMTVPSGAQTGLKLNINFDIVLGSSYELVVDFDVSRSVVITGPPSAPGYILKPTLRVVPSAISGSISGEVTNLQHLPTAYAIAGLDTITGSIVDNVSGEFMLAFLPAGSYTVVVSDTMEQAFVQADVEVTAGEDQNIGVITLQ